MEQPDVDAARAGSADAFERLAEPYRRELQVHCYRMLGTIEDAEDAVQETYLRAWRRLDSYAGSAPFRAWLYGIATHACLDALRRRKARVWPTDVSPPGDPRRGRRRRSNCRGCSPIPTGCSKRPRLPRTSRKRS